MTQRNSSGALIAGGPRQSADIERTLTLPFQPGYRNDASLSARRRDLFEIMAHVARQLRPYAIGRQEYHALTDAMRSRLSGRTLYYMARISARAPGHLAFALENGVQEAVLNEMTKPAVPCALVASLDEQRANEPLNEAQLKAHDEKTAERWLHVAELCAPQIEATKQLRVAAIVRAGGR